MRPETLEQCLAWLIADVNGVVSSWTDIDGDRVVSAVGEVRHPNGPRHPHGMAVAKSGDIPAAIIAATQQVWDQVHGEASESPAAR